MKKMRPSKKSVAAVIFLLLLGAGAFLLMIYRANPDCVWNLMECRDELVKSDIIFVSSGDICSRFLFGLQLFDSGYGEKIAVTLEAVPESLMRCKERYGFLDQRALVERKCAIEKIRDNDIVFLEGSCSSYSDCTMLKEYWDSDRFDSVIIITNPIHSNRLNYIMQKVFSDTSTEIISYPTYPEVSIRERYHDSSSYIIKEYLKFLFYRLRYIIIAYPFSRPETVCAESAV